RDSQPIVTAALTGNGDRHGRTVAVTFRFGVSIGAPIATGRQILSWEHHTRQLWKAGIHPGVNDSDGHALASRYRPDLVLDAPRRKPPLLGVRPWCGTGRTDGEEPPSRHCGQRCH